MRSIIVTVTVRCNLPDVAEVGSFHTRRRMEHAANNAARDAVLDVVNLISVGIGPVGVAGGGWTDA